ncbi:hypothetical protein BT67DRAFT_159271 [Trichocladium antarcticum]|uniref:Uncharacterized protein n=1 Tax=Trichocladium antarcticum TaxID=1450529 RepID=A0AAN6ZAM5_9PEZI|nr:hypothetical protein BT67DRAFT_159271 [Trichocladium antarcticum]
MEDLRELGAPQLVSSRFDHSSGGHFIDRDLSITRDAVLGEVVVDGEVPHSPFPRPPLPDHVSHQWPLTKSPAPTAAQGSYPSDLGSLESWTVSGARPRPLPSVQRRGTASDAVSTSSCAVHRTRSGDGV